MNTSAVTAAVSSDPDAARTAALAEIRRAQARYRAAFAAAALFEVAFLAALVLGANLSDRLERLVVIGAVGTYTMVILGLVALAVHVDRGLLRIQHGIGAVWERIPGQSSPG